MPSRKITERERLTLYARTASDDELDQALEILRIEERVRRARKPAANKPKPATKKPAGVPAPTPPLAGPAEG